MILFSSVDSILASINKKVEKLRKLADAKDGEASEYAIISNEYSALAKLSVDESVRARKVANKLKDLIS
jgi:hypothetical protein